MTEFIRYFIFTFVIFYIFVLLLYITINPKNENSFFINTIMEESSFLTSKYLFNKLKNDKYTLIFGTSRSAKISSKMFGSNVLNLSQSIYGNPNDVLYFLNLLDKVQWNNINKIYYLVDNHTFLKRTYYNFDYSSCVLLEQIKHFDANNLVLSIRSIYFNIFNIKPFKGINTDGSTYNNNEQLARKYQFDYYDFKKEFQFNKHEFTILKDIKTLVDKNNKEIIFFTSTMNLYYLKSMKKDLFLSHRKQLIENCGNLVELSYIHPISNKIYNFTDPTHMTTTQTKYVLDNLLKNKNYTYTVNSDRYDEFYKTYFNTIDMFNIDSFLHHK